MTFLTSNFRQAGRHPQAVAISRGVPKGWKGRRCLALAPPWELVKEQDEAKFRAGYERDVLSKLDAAAIAQELGDGAILLCWEAPGLFCHRLVVAEWLRDRLGVEVTEYIPIQKESRGDDGLSGDHANSHPKPPARG